MNLNSTKNNMAFKMVLVDFNSVLSTLTSYSLLFYANSYFDKLNQYKCYDKVSSFIVFLEFFLEKRFNEQ